MKDYFLLSLAFVCATGVFAQRVVDFATSATDTSWIQEDQVEVIKETSTSGSVIFYEGAKKDTISKTDSPATITTAINEL